MTKRMLVFCAALGILSLPGCTVDAPEPARPSPGPSLAAASPLPVAAPGGVDQIRRRGVALQALTDPANPLGFDAQEKAQMAVLLRQLEMYRDRYEFREAQVYAILKDLWRPGVDVAPPPGSTPEGTFAVNARAARKALQARAGDTKAEAAPYPASLLQPRTELGADDPDEPWETVVASDQRHVLPALPQFMEEVAPRATPEQAARALAELAFLEDLAREQEVAWKDLLRIVESGKRRDELKKLAVAGEETNLSPLLDRSIAWAYGTP